VAPPVAAPQDGADWRAGAVGTGDLPEPLARALATIGCALDVLADVDPAGLTGRGTEQLALGLHALAERAAAGVTATLPLVERDGLWALDAEATFPRWVARRLGLSVASARSRVRLARTLRDHLPATRDAVRAGEIGTEATAAIAVAATSQARRDVLADRGHACNEAFLVEQARRLPVDDLRAVVRVWSCHADPDTDERGFREATEREHLTLSRLPYGYRVDGQLTAEHGQQLSTALAGLTPVPAADDARSTAQRRAQALADLARTVIEHHPVGAGRVSRPRVSVLVDHATLAGLVERGLRRAGDAQGAADREGSGTGAARFTPDDLRTGAFFADGTHVPRDVLDRLACDGELQRILFAPDGEVIDVGRTRRIFTGAARTAVVARDGRCAYPGCSAPPQIGEVHHVRHWVRDGGHTEPRNGVLLCYHHHEVVHRRGLEVARAPEGWVFTDRRGTVLRL
jgi:hypothetical protein